jgi:4-hydroxythreonine-4-phosphate dehydrogenase
VIRTRVAVTAGEPAGIGPDLVITLAGEDWEFGWVVYADPELLRHRAATLGVAMHIEIVAATTPLPPHRAGQLPCVPVPGAIPVRAGVPDPGNAAHVLDTIRTAALDCRAGLFQALTTGPVHKAVINDAGFAFSGHTEYLAELTGAPQPVMLMASPGLRVALATTHIPLRAVAGALSPARLESVLRVLAHDLETRFGLVRPRILVCGLNPHAGEAGHLGREDIEIIAPVVQRLVSQGLRLTGPVPADSAFAPAQLAATDAVLAMYHDQGLPVVKHVSFDSAVNVTLGLPIVRTSVDHGTALALAATGRADPGSFRAALRLAGALGGQSH